MDIISCRCRVRQAFSPEPARRFRFSTMPSLTPRPPEKSVARLGSLGGFVSSQTRTKRCLESLSSLTYKTDILLYITGPPHPLLPLSPKRSHSTLPPSLLPRTNNYHTSSSSYLVLLLFSTSSLSRQPSHSLLLRRESPTHDTHSKSREDSQRTR